MVRKKIPMVSSHTLTTYKDIPGPTYRDCQSCHTRPAVRTATQLTGPNKGHVVHLCDRCKPNGEWLIQGYDEEEDV